MPSGTTHAKATLALAVTGGVLAHQFGYPALHVAALSGGTLAGLILTPDLDVDRGCISNRIVRYTTGHPAGWAWRAFWRPYGKMLRHRSRLSHLPLVGTMLRLAYLLVLPLLIIWLATGALPSLELPGWGWWAFAGLALSDAVHYLMDRLV